MTHTQTDNPRRADREDGCAWYSSRSGWMVQAPTGFYAIDSFRPCAAHEPQGRRDCEQCDDGPMVEAGYVLGDYDGAGIPIYESGSYADDDAVAYADYQTAGSWMRVSILADPDDSDQGGA